MEKFLIFKLIDCAFMPFKISDVPIVLDPDIADEDRGDYSQLKLTGDGMDINTLSQILFKTYPVPMEGIFDAENKLEENLHDSGREVPDNEPGS